MYCYKCGKQIPDDALYCPHCGAKQNASGIEKAFDNIENGFEEAMNQAELREERQQQDYGSYRPQGNPPAISDGVASFLKWFVCILAGFYYAPGIVKTFFASFSEFTYYGPIKAFILNLRVYAILLVSIFTFASFVIFALNRKKTQTAELLGATVLATGLLYLTQFGLNLLYGIIFPYAYIYHGEKYLGFFFCLMLFVICLLNGDRTLLDLDYSNMSELLADILNAFIEGLNLSAAGAKMDQTEERYRNQHPERYDDIRETEGYVTDNRTLLGYILLTVFTCGIYGFYFIHSMARDVNTICDDDQPTAGLGMYLLLSILTCGFYSVYWEYRLANRLAENAPKYGLNFSENGTAILIWHTLGMLLFGFGPIVAVHILINNMNRLAAAYNREYGYTYQG